MEEYLEIIKDRIDYCKNDPRIMIDNDNFIFIQSIEKLLYEYQKEKRENEELKKSKYVYGIDMDFDYIPKQKIRDKIEELKEDKENKYYDKFLEYRDLETTLEILEKLLGKED